MQEYKKTVITKDQVVPIAEKMRKAGNALVMIHGFIDNDGQMDVSWDYAVDPAIESYHVIGETVLPSIGEIYDTAATAQRAVRNRVRGTRCIAAALPAGGHARNAGQGPDNGHAAFGASAEKH